MALSDFADQLGPAITRALETRGFADLTAVQRAVLDPALDNRDLRISSQTGSGKTVAIGLVVRAKVGAPGVSGHGSAKPSVLVVAPTRELAKQVEGELSWLFADLGARVVPVIGGSVVRDERRALSRGASIVVGTPGRLLDHLERGAIDASGVDAVVLDEADQMLDLGFREELAGILSKLPHTRRTHMVSATFARPVQALADEFQKDAIYVQGTKLGAPNKDIEHLVHLVWQEDRFAGVVNLLLASPDEQALIFARTRADVGALAEALREAGFPVRALSGDLEQRERERALGELRSGALRALVATDVAARGLDIEGIGHVIQVDPPGDPDAYTHRSGRTGRAGRAGKSSIFVPPQGFARVQSLLRRAGVTWKLSPIPTPDEIRERADEALFTELTSEHKEENISERIWVLAKRLAKAPAVSRVLARLLAHHGSAVVEPLSVKNINPDTVMSSSPMRDRRRSRYEDERPRMDRGERPLPVDRGEHAPKRRASHAEHEERAPARRTSHDKASHMDIPQAEDTRARAPRFERIERPPVEAERPAPRARAMHTERPRPPEGAPEWVAFDVSWGSTSGADARRLLAMACRRGRIRGADIGAIRIGARHSQIEVARDVAGDFERAAGVADPRDPKVRIVRSGKAERRPRD